MSEAIRDLISGVLKRAGIAVPETSAEPPPAEPAAAEAGAWFDDQEGEDEFVPVGVDGLLEASTKLLAINRGLEEPDEKESLAFKRFVSPERMIRERIRLDDGKVRLTMLRQAAKRRTLKHLPPGFLSSYTKRLLIGNPLAMPLEETNPLSLVEQARRVTQMGPGGIGSLEAVTPDQQAVQPSSFGFIGPSEGPESSSAGIDVRLAWGTRLGSDGRIYQKVLDPRLKRHVWVSPDDLQHKRLAISD